MTRMPLSQHRSPIIVQRSLCSSASPLLETPPYQHKPRFTQAPLRDSAYLPLVPAHFATTSYNSSRLPVTIVAQVLTPLFPFAAAPYSVSAPTETKTTTTTPLGTAVNMYAIGGFNFAAGNASQF